MLEIGCEIRTSGCVHSGVMLKLNVLKTAEGEQHSADEGMHRLNHGTAVMKELALP